MTMKFELLEFSMENLNKLDLDDMLEENSLWHIDNNKIKEKQQRFQEMLEYTKEHYEEEERLAWEYPDDEIDKEYLVKIIRSERDKGLKRIEEALKMADKALEEMEEVKKLLDEHTINLLEE